VVDSIEASRGGVAHRRGLSAVVAARQWSAPVLGRGAVGGTGGRASGHRSARQGLAADGGFKRRCSLYSYRRPRMSGREMVASATPVLVNGDLRGGEEKRGEWRPEEERRPARRAHDPRLDEERRNTWSARPH
jgi:hypothetical protein